jgi:hypothetical protein
MSETERLQLAVRLKLAIDQMAGRYGIGCIEQACARPGSAEHLKACRKTARQYRTLMRLTHAFAELAAGGTR